MFAGLTNNYCGEVTSAVNSVNLLPVYAGSGCGRRFILLSDPAVGFGRSPGRRRTPAGTVYGARRARLTPLPIRPEATMGSAIVASQKHWTRADSGASLPQLIASSNVHPESPPQ